MYRLAEVGIDMDDVGAVLEDRGLAAFRESFEGVLAALGRHGGGTTRPPAPAGRMTDLATAGPRG